MLRFWIVSRFDDGVSFYESYEPVVAVSKDHIVEAIAKQALEKQGLLRQKDSAHREFERNPYSKQIRDEYIRASEAVPNVASFSDTYSARVIESDGSICADFDIFDMDEFFHYMKVPGPAPRGDLKVEGSAPSP